MSQQQTQLSKTAFTQTVKAKKWTDLQEMLAAWRAEHAEESLDLSGIILLYTTIACLDLSGANLQNAVLKHCIIKECNLEGADLTRANLEGTYWDAKTKLPNTNLTGANLKSADMEKASADDAKVVDAKVDRHTKLPKNVFGSTLVRHED